MAEEALVMWALYERPRDYPDYYVARQYLVHAGVVEVTDRIRIANSLEQLRRQIPEGLHRLPRFTQDDPCIVEVWI